MAFRRVINRLGQMKTQRFPFIVVSISEIKFRGISYEKAHTPIEGVQRHFQSTGFSELDQFIYPISIRN